MNLNVQKVTIVEKNKLEKMIQLYLHDFEYDKIKNMEYATKKKNLYSQ